ncbi:hypothetical protein NUW58_g73 [Xylaria curta]|uniref:Uncharacterized protein n=2 Tax=Xylaria curta TaxID=42375 RepID=A0ACC1PRP5_9PEZI|nr:hypothetical protein NUW58_g1758 [Xylaria curta]KAJ2999201.1 hypothetical protein NUW58_g73 [Xylaria curta]
MAPPVQQPKYTKPEDSAAVREHLEKSAKHMKAIISTNVDRPIGPYSHGNITVVEPVQGLVFLCGQCPVLPDGTVIDGTPAEKTRQMCENAKHALEEAGTSLDKVIKVQMFFTDIADYEESNSVYIQYFPHIPARSAMEVSKIPPRAPPSRWIALLSNKGFDTKTPGE